MGRGENNGRGTTTLVPDPPMHTASIYRRGGGRGKKQLESRSEISTVRGICHSLGGGGKTVVGYTTPLPAYRGRGWAKPGDE